MTKEREGAATVDHRRDVAAEKAIDDLLGHAWSSVGQVSLRAAIRMARKSAAVTLERRQRVKHHG